MDSTTTPVDSTTTRAPDGAPAPTSPTDLRVTREPVPDFEPEATPGQRAVEQAATSDKGAAALSAEERLDATEWLLTTDPTTLKGTASLEVNVGTDEQPRIITWEVEALDLPGVEHIRKTVQALSRPNRSTRRAGAQRGEEDFDAPEFQRRIVAAATTSPDLRAVADQRGFAPGAQDPLMGPSALLESMFQYKPGLVGGIWSYIMGMSGIGETDVMKAAPPADAIVTRAVGNS